MKFFKKLNSNNIGSITYNRVLCYWIMVMVLFFGVDMCILVTQSVVTSYQTAYYAEKLSVQGGLIGAEKILPGERNSAKECNSCLTNEEISTSFGSTMENFGLTSFDWLIALDDETDNRTWIHSNGQTQNKNLKLRLRYMSVNEIYVASKFTPMVSGWMWDGTLIEKEIAFISEYVER